VPPLERSAPSRTFIVLVSLIFGVTLGLGVVLVEALFTDVLEDRTERAKLEALQDALRPARLLPARLMPARWRPLDDNDDNDDNDNDDASAEHGAR
jgi:hypothetical protein